MRARPGGHGDSRAALNPRRRLTYAPDMDTVVDIIVTTLQPVNGPACGTSKELRERIEFPLPRLGERHRNIRTDILDDIDLALMRGMLDGWRLPDMYRETREYGPLFRIRT